MMTWQTFPGDVSGSKVQGLFFKCFHSPDLCQMKFTMTQSTGKSLSFVTRDHYKN